MLGRRRLLSWASRTLVWCAVAVPAQSALWADVAVLIKLLVVAMAALAAWRPAAALVALAGLIPFGNALTRFTGAFTLGLSEALVLAFLAGWWFPLRRRLRAVPDALSRAALIFAAVILATCAVQFAIERAWQDHWRPFTLDFLRYFATDYLTAQPDVRPNVRGAGFFPPAMLWLEGIAMVLATRMLCQLTPGLFDRVIRIIVIAAVGAASLSFMQIFEVGERYGLSPIGAMLSRFRFSAAIPSIGPTGSYFMMVLWVAAGLAVAAVGWRVVGWAVSAVLLGVAGWLSKSRGPIIAAVATAGAWGTFLGLQRIRNRHVWAVAVAGAVALFVAGGLIAFNPPGMLRPGAEESLHLRSLLLRGSVAMIQAHPTFGVGIKQFRLRYPEFRPRDAKNPSYIEDDPHNHFLGVAAELGLVGLAAFLLFVGAALWRATKVLTVQPINYRALGAVAGILCFIGTWLSHQSLTVPTPAFTFWILLGAVIGIAPQRIVAAPSRRGAMLTAATAVAVLAIVASVPSRARAWIDPIDLGQVQYGFHEWEVDGAGTRFHWTTRHSTLFLSREMSLINLPVSASMDGTPGGVDVRIEINGDDAGHLRLTDEAWHDIRLVSPRSDNKTWRIDLYVSPTWVPSEIGRNPDDARELGIRVQEPVQRR
jgi:O-antigen ligase